MGVNLKLCQLLLAYHKGRCWVPPCFPSSVMTCPISLRAGWRPTASHVRRRYHHLCLGSCFWSGGFQVKWSPSIGCIHGAVRTVSLHPTTTDYTLLSWRGQLTGQKKAIKMGDHVIEEVVSTKCLGVQMDNALKWDHHANGIGTNEVVYAEVEFT